MNEITEPTTVWRQYEAGRDWKRRIGLYENARRNERFYRGDQWRGGGDLPRPVFNVVRRVTDYLVSSAALGSVRITYTDDNLPFARNSREAEIIENGVKMLTLNAAYRWEHERLQSLVRRLLLDAALSGDGCVYCWWDGDKGEAGDWSGDIHTSAIDGMNIFPADVTLADIQSQEYVIVSGRSTLSALRAEARAAGVPADLILRIRPDESGDRPLFAGELGDVPAVTEPEDAPVTFLLRFHRENGFVVFEKVTRECVIRRVQTRCRLYPLAYFSWIPTKDCFHGTSPVTGLIENQKYVNRAFAMLMKHMTDSAFSKVIYDASKIPEWTNEVGEAIAAVGSGNVADAVHLIEPGRLESGYLDVIGQAIALSKELSGATETSLGNTAPTNTSAILALRETSLQTLQGVRTALSLCLEQMAAIWADMTLAYCPDGRPLRTPAGFGRFDATRLRDALLSVNVEIVDGASYSSAGTQAVLDELLREGHISFVEYLERVPDGIIPGREALLRARTGEEAERVE